MKKRQTILIVEDDALQMRHYTVLAERSELDPLTTTSLEGALQILTQRGVDILLTDIHLSGSQEMTSFEGIELLRNVTARFPETLAIAMSSDPKVDTYTKAIAAGACHYLRKPVLSAQELAISIDVARARRRLTSLAGRPVASEATPLTQWPDGLVLPDEIRRIARKIAHAPHLPVVIHGETGTGKEEVAKLIHRERTEIAGPVPFVAVNCSHLNTDVAMAALFGHQKGAFTGASETRRGYVEEADGGILFLDEVHTLSIEVQRRLLRVLNDGSFERLGDTRTLHSEFQVIVASTQDLDRLVEEGAFLLDLRMRMTGIDVVLPPLRARLKDIEAFVCLFLAGEGAVIDADELTRIVIRCQRYYWQGNIRQLKRVIQAATVTASFNDEPLRASHLPEYRTMFSPDSVEDIDAPTAKVTATHPSNNDDVVQRILQALREDLPFDDSLEHYERAILAEAFARHRTAADVANALGMAKSSLSVKRKKLSV